MSSVTSHCCFGEIVNKFSEYCICYKSKSIGCQIKSDRKVTSYDFIKSRILTYYCLNLQKTLMLTQQEMEGDYIKPYVFRENVFFFFK